MKRVHSNDQIKAASKSVKGQLAGLNLTSKDASVLEEMMSIANDHAKELSADQLAIVQAGVGGKPISSCSEQ